MSPTPSLRSRNKTSKKSSPLLPTESKTPQLWRKNCATPSNTSHSYRHLLLSCLMPKDLSKCQSSFIFHPAPRSGTTPLDGMEMKISVTSSITPKQELPAPHCSQCLKLLGFLQLSWTVTPHLDLSQYDLKLGPRKTWQQVVKEWREEQLAMASTRRAVTERRRHLELCRQEVCKMQDRQMKTTTTGTTTQRST